MADVSHATFIAWPAGIERFPSPDHGCAVFRRSIVVEKPHKTCGSALAAVAAKNGAIKPTRAFHKSEVLANYQTRG